MKIAILAFLLTSLTAVSANADLPNCHDIVGNKIMQLGKDAYTNRQISRASLIWLRDNLAVAVARSKGNYFSCMTSEGNTSVAFVLLVQLKPTPIDVTVLLMSNQRVLNYL